ncbi:hypothetical protein Goklo_002968 [Gossypium klotzschianum]|nr:hypothetical protein [Gossypium klotzschianum]
MGAFCCCSCGDDCEEYAYPSNSIYRHCICLRFFFYQLFTGYGALFHRLDGRPASQIQGASLSSTTTVTAISDNSAIETHVTMSRPVPYDAEQRYSRLQRDGLVSRRDKSVTHFQEETQPLRRNISSSDGESLGIGRKWNGVELEDDSKIVHLELSERSLAPKVAQGPNYIQPSAEEEDVCPTCLDEYTPENPKITARCSHHFHLGCIYEWLERSESCPICGKVCIVGQITPSKMQICAVSVVWFSPMGYLGKFHNIVNDNNYQDCRLNLWGASDFKCRCRRWSSVKAPKVWLHLDSMQ